MGQIFKDVICLLQQVPKFIFQFAPTEANNVAHRLARFGLVKEYSLFWIEVPLTLFRTSC